MASDRELANAVEQALGGKPKGCQAIKKNADQCDRPYKWRVYWRGTPYYFCGSHIKSQVTSIGFSEAHHISGETVTSHKREWILVFKDIERLNAKR